MCAGVNVTVMSLSRYAGVYFYYSKKLVLYLPSVIIGAERRMGGLSFKRRETVAVGFSGVPGSKSSQLLHGSDFFILFHHFYLCKYSNF